MSYISRLQTCTALCFCSCICSGIGGSPNNTQLRRRNQYLANLLMKINAKLGGINTKLAASIGEIMPALWAGAGTLGHQKMIRAT